MRWPPLLMAIFAVVVGYALRAYRIDGQSLWYDEGVSAVMAQRDFLSITFNAAADIHPPLYYYLLHTWSWFAGTGELALRWLSLSYGVLLVVVVFKLGQKLFGPWVAFFAALLTAFAPFPIYYSQEARMYMQVAFFGALSTYLFLEAQSHFFAGQNEDENKQTTLGAKRPIVFYALSSIALLYSHYFAFSILVIQNAWVILRFATLSVPFSSRLRSLFSWIVLQTAIVASFIPWLALSFSQVGGWPSISEPMSLGTLSYKVFQVFTFGLSWDAAATPRKEQLFFFLIAASVLTLLTRRKRATLAFGLAVLYCAIPIIIMYLLSLNRPMYNPKFLLLATPGYFLILGLGMTSVGKSFSAMFGRLALPIKFCRFVEGAVVVLLMLAASFSMWQSTEAYYFEAKYARDDYRGLTRAIQSQIQPGDAIVLEAPGQIEIFNYYFQGKHPVYPLPEDRPIDKARTAEALERIIGEHKRVWLVLWAQKEADPEEFLEHWLDENAFKAGNTWFGGIRLAQYVSAQDGAAGWRKNPDVVLGGAIRLEEISLGSLTGRPGDILDITLHWRAIRPVTERYVVFLHVIDHDEYLWGQRDSEPGGGTRITTGWRVDEIVQDRHGVPIVLGTPPGRYQIEAGLYDQETGRRMPIVDEQGNSLGDRLLFGQIEVGKATKPVTTAGLDLQNRVAVAYGDGLSLLGFDFHKLGQPEVRTEFSRSEAVLVTLYWQANETPRQDYLVRLEVVGPDERTSLGRLVEPVAGRYSTTLWETGELVRDQHRLVFSDLEPDDYSLRVGLVDRQSKAPVLPKTSARPLVENDAVELATFRVK